MYSRRVALGFIALVCSCRADLQPPVGAQIACAEDKECPTSYICATTLHRCVAQGSGSDTNPPGLINGVVLDPNPVGKDQTLRLRFDANETLGAQPEVRILWPNGESASLSLENATDEHYTYTYPTTASDLEGSADLFIRLLDLNGNIGRIELPRAVLFDFTAPQIASAQLLYNPEPGNPLLNIQALHNGASVRLAFYSNEPLLGTPLVSATCAQGAFFLNRLPGENSSTFFSYEFTLSNAVAGEGECVLSISGSDSAANALAPYTGPPLLIDRTAPEALVAIDKNRIKHLRAPWGSLQSGAPGHFVVPRSLAVTQDPATATIEAQAFGQSGETIVEARAYSKEVGGQFLGRSSKAADQSWPAMILFGADSAEVWLSVIDGAGNESSRSLLLAGEWVATMGEKVVGSTLENPHVFSTRRIMTGVQQAEAPEIGDNSGLNALGNPLQTLGSASIRARPLLPRLGNVFAPGIATFANMSLWGGAVIQHDGATWRWDGDRWLNVVPTDPEADGSPHYGRCMAEDTSRRKVVLIASHNPDFLEATWEWDGQSWAYVYQGPELPSGSQSESCSLAYDSARKKMVLVLGVGAVYERGDGPWRRVIPNNSPASLPNLVSDWTLAYHEGLKKILLFGGKRPDSGPPTALSNELWSWDGAAWTLVISSGTPAPRYGAGLVYDAKRNVLVMYGGRVCGSFGNCDFNNSALNDLWEWSANTWSQPALSDPEHDGAPANSYWQQMIYDGASEQPLLLRKSQDGNPNGIEEMWAWTGTSWRKLAQADPESNDSPGLRVDPALSYDVIRTKAVLFGGCTGSGCPTPLSDTWEWNGYGWDPIPFTDPDGDSQPSARSGAAATFNSDAPYIMLYGGSGAHDLWTWDGVSWKSLAQPGGDPGIRAQSAMVYDSANHKAILFGGRAGAVFGDTWEWDHNKGEWAPVTTILGGDGDPAARYNHAMAYDAKRAVVVLYGGCSASANQYCPDGTGQMGLSDTWEYANAEWILKTPSDAEGDGNPVSPRGSPPFPFTRGYGGPRLVYDEERGRVVLFGDSQGLWEWRGDSWRRLHSSDPDADLNPGLSIAAAYDIFRRRSVIFDGGTWTLDSGAEKSPAHVWAVSANAARLPQATNVLALSVAWYGQAILATAAEPLALELLEHGRWQRLASQAQNAAGQVLLTYSNDDFNTLENLRAGQNPTFYLRLTATTGNEEEQLQLSSDYAEARLTYHHSTCRALNDGNACDDGDAGSSESFCLGERCVSSLHFCELALSGTACDSLVGAPALCYAGSCVPEQNLPRYRWISFTAPWEQARAVCADWLLSDLAVIADSAELVLVESAITGSSGLGWIGLSDALSEGNFSWTDSSPIDNGFAPWNSGEPNNAGGNENCVEMNAVTGNWNDAPCITPRAAICERH